MVPTTGMPPRPVSSLVLALVVALAGCKGRDAAPPDLVTPATEAEAQTYGQAVARALSGCDPDAVLSLIDIDNVARRAAAGRKVPAAARAGFVRGARQAGFGKSLCADLGEGAVVTFLRTRDHGHGPSPLVRVLSEGGLNYLEFEIGRVPRSDTVRAVDFHNFMAGEPVSAALGRLFEAMMVRNDPERSVRSVGELKEARAKLVAGDVAGARALHDGLPEPLRRDKSIRLFEIQIASEEEDATYLASLERFRRDFPDDPALKLMAVDRSFLRKEFEQGLAAIDQLDAEVGGDGYLDALRASALGALGRHADAIVAARRAVVAVPELQSAWWTLVTAQLAGKDHAGVAASMDAMRGRFILDLDAATIRADPLWADFAASPEGRAWLQALAAPAPIE